MARAGDWMQTYTGAAFWPLDPRIEDIHIEDIVASLSKLCRYNGHCFRFYSVAEHSMLVALKAPEPLKLTALMHDASEAYLTDVIRPIKPFLREYHAIEDRLQAMIAERFGLTHPLPEEIKALDNGILRDELAQNMAPAPAEWRFTDQALGVTLRCWPPEEAARHFRLAFYAYGGVA